MDEVLLETQKIEKTERKRLIKLFKHSVSPKTMSSAVHSVHQKIDLYFEQNTKKYNIKLACKEGCTYCCKHFLIEAFLPEIFRIKDYLEKKLSTEALSNIKLAVSETAERARGLSNQEYSSTRITCPLLITNTCSIYAVRPGMCRKYHSLDVESCIKSYKEPDNPVHGALSVRGLSLGVMSFLKSLHHSLKKKNLDGNTYELSQALNVVLNNPKAYAQWCQGKIIFTPLSEEKKGQERLSSRDTKT
ncbi:MAG: YkgJ family cysteine cluster protein [Gammaproteobacteria bacterium]|nr:YkgJ family cysteine cluster protein [Gammaproteobacteria bacterium]